LRGIEAPAWPSKPDRVGCGGGKLPIIPSPSVPAGLWWWRREKASAPDGLVVASTSSNCMYVHSSSDQSRRPLRPLCSSLCSSPCSTQTRRRRRRWAQPSGTSSLTRIHNDFISHNFFSGLAGPGAGTWTWEPEDSIRLSRRFTTGWLVVRSLSPCHVHPTLPPSHFQRTPRRRPTLVLPSHSLDRYRRHPVDTTSEGRLLAMSYQYVPMYQVCM
jgi:hypothetical protein